MKNTSPGSINGGGATANGPGKADERGWTPPAPIHDAIAAQLPTPTLTQSEAKDLERLEEVVHRSWYTFLEVGHALIEIQTKALYRDGYTSFEDYCRDRLHISRPYAYNLIGSAEVSKQLSSIEDIEIKPVNEAQCRELISIPETKRVAAWKSAIKLAGDAPVTAKVVHRVAAEFKSKKMVRPVKSMKRSIGPPLNLEPAFKLIDDLEKLALAAKNKPMLAKVAALRGFLLNFGGN